MYSNELKIKRLSLGAEARIIRDQIAVQSDRLERRLAKARAKASKGGEVPPEVVTAEFVARHGLGETIRSLRDHHINVVRPAARAAHLAHTFLRGRPYATAEDPERTRKPVLVEAVAKNVRTFGGGQFAKMSVEAQRKSVYDWTRGGAPVGVTDSNPESAGSTPAAPATIAAE